MRWRYVENDQKIFEIVMFIVTQIFAKQRKEHDDVI